MSCVRCHKILSQAFVLLGDEHDGDVKTLANDMASRRRRALTARKGSRAAALQGTQFLMLHPQVSPGAKLSLAHHKANQVRKRLGQSAREDEVLSFFRHLVEQQAKSSPSSPDDAGPNRGRANSSSETSYQFYRSSREKVCSKCAERLQTVWAGKAKGASLHASYYQAVRQSVSDALARDKLQQRRRPNNDDDDAAEEEQMGSSQSLQCCRHQEPASVTTSAELNSLRGRLAGARRRLAALRAADQALDRQLADALQVLCMDKLAEEAATADWRAEATAAQQAQAVLSALSAVNVHRDTFDMAPAAPNSDLIALNGCRLGRTRGQLVGWDEINAALGQAALLLYTLDRKLVSIAAAVSAAASSSGVGNDGDNDDDHRRRQLKRRIAAASVPLVWEPVPCGSRSVMRWARDPAVFAPLYGSDQLSFGTFVSLKRLASAVTQFGASAMSLLSTSLLGSKSTSADQPALADSAHGLESAADKTSSMAPSSGELPMDASAVVFAVEHHYGRDVDQPGKQQSGARSGVIGLDAGLSAFLCCMVQVAERMELLVGPALQEHGLPGLRLPYQMNLARADWGSLRSIVDERPKTTAAAVQIQTASDLDLDLHQDLSSVSSTSSSPVGGKLDSRTLSRFASIQKRGDDGSRALSLAVSRSTEKEWTKALKYVLTNLNTMLACLVAFQRTTESASEWEQSEQRRVLNEAAAKAAENNRQTFETRRHRRRRQRETIRKNKSSSNED